MKKKTGSFQRLITLRGKSSKISTWRFGYSSNNRKMNEMVDGPCSSIDSSTGHMMNGKGKMKFANGDIYVGEWR